MKIYTDKTDQQQVNITIEVHDEDMENHIQRACKKMSVKMNFPGFRKGKVPRSVLENTFGKPRLIQESLDTLIPDVVFKAVDQENLEIVSTPVVSVESIEPKVEILAKVALVPIVKLTSFEKFKIHQSKNKVSVKEINNVINQVRESQVNWVPVERLVKRGDLLILDLQIISEEKVVTDQKKMEYIVDYGKNHIESIPGFAQKLIKMNIGAGKNFDLEFPDNFPDESLRNKVGDFKVFIHEVKEKSLPALTDDFAKSLGEGLKDVRSLKEKIRENLKLTAEHEWNQRIIEDFIDKTIESSEFILAPILIDQESENMIKRQKEYMESKKVDFEEYLKNSKKTYDELLEELREPAEKNIHKSLVINEIATKENIEVDDEKVEKELLEWGKKNTGDRKVSKDQIKQNIRQSLKDKLVMDKILELAKNKVLDSIDNNEKK